MTPEQAITLGKISQKIDDMCDSNKRDHGEIKDQIQVNLESVESRFNNLSSQKHERMIECGKMFDQRPKMNLFLWVMGGVFTCLLILGGMVINLDDKMTTHIQRAKHAFHQITGEEYTPPELKK